jgi:Ca-activated chloride channel homolog
MTEMIASERRLKRESCLSAQGHCWTDMSNTLTGRKLLICLMVFAVLIAAPGAAWAQIVSSSSRNHTSGDYTLSVNANLVILSATVLDRHNALVSGLGKEDFKVYEDHVLQQIKDFSHEDLPVTVGLVIDNSGSMAPKRTDVIAAALSFARSSNPQDQMFVVNFNENVSYGLPADIPFTDRLDQLQLGLSDIKAIGETALYDAIVVALDHLKQGSCDKKVLILISDGGDNASKHNLAQVIEMARHSGAIIYAIGIFDEQDGDQNPDVLKRFAKETGGEAFLPESSKEMALICERIAHDIRNQYTLAYVPTIQTQDGGYRVIDVKVSSPRHGRLSARTRAGYFVPLTLPAPGLGTAGHDSHN